MICTIVKMRRKLERSIEASCCRYAEMQGWEHVKLDRAKRGWPDRLYLGPNSLVLLVEFKRPGERPRPQQLANHRRLSDLGHPVALVDSADQFRHLLDSLAGPSKRPEAS